MTFTGMLFLLLCAGLFVFRKKLFNGFGTIVYRSMQKGLSSCDGKISVAEKEIQNETDGNVLYINSSQFHNGFILNVKSIGQNFDLNAPKNVKYSTPSPYQDLNRGNGLA